MGTYISWTNEFRVLWMCKGACRWITYSGPQGKLVFMLASFGK